MRPLLVERASPKQPYSGFWFYDYPEDESFRNVYGNVQVPLSWATLLIWSVLPFFAPCRVVETDLPGDVAARRMRIVATLRKAAKAAGANLLIVTKLGDLYWPNVPVPMGGPDLGPLGGLTVGVMMTGNGVAIRDMGAGSK